MSMANDEQDQLLRHINEFKSKKRPQYSEALLKGEKKWYLKYLKFINS